MNKIIRQIFTGFDRLPSDLVSINSPRYIQSRDKGYKAHEDLRSKFPQELLEEFDHLMECDLETLGIGQEDGFIDGFRFGAMLMIEILS